MKNLNTTPVNAPVGSYFTRQTVRAIVHNGTELLMLYTERYDDYSLPGGGVDEHESLEQALIRELQEETGAKSITNITPFGQYQEYRPWYKEQFDFVHIVSNCYVCEICGDFATPKMEDYERNNGMKPVWICPKRALEHNQRTLKNSPKKGQSLLREIHFLQLINQFMAELPKNTKIDNI